MKTVTKIDILCFFPITGNFDFGTNNLNILFL